jgi:hypothetical protein
VKRAPGERHRILDSSLLRLVIVCLVLNVAACARGGAPSASNVYAPPPPLALVAIIDPSPDRLAAQLHQLEDVIRSRATPGEAVVVMFLDARVTRTYVVHAGDNLSSIAAANGVTLANVQAANPQFGPLFRRSWSLIHPGEPVTVPDGQVRNPLALVTRAPAGPPPPTLVRVPQEPNNPTDFQRAEYMHALAAATTTNDARVAAWRAEAANAVQPWQQQVVNELDRMPGSQATGAGSATGPLLSSSITAASTTLHGLPGRRLLLVLGGGQSGPSGSTPSGLVDINLVIANLSDSGAAAAWTAAGRNAGAASVSTLDPALTQLQLAQVVNQ